MYYYSTFWQFKHNSAFKYNRRNLNSIHLLSRNKRIRFGFYIINVTFSLTPKNDKTEELKKKQSGKCVSIYSNSECRISETRDVHTKPHVPTFQNWFLNEIFDKTLTTQSRRVSCFEFLLKIKYSNIVNSSLELLNMFSSCVLYSIHWRSRTFFIIFFSRDMKTCVEACFVNIYKDNSALKR